MRVIETAIPCLIIKTNALIWRGHLIMQVARWIGMGMVSLTMMINALMNTATRMRVVAPSVT
jgi:hypothetical protein